MLEMARRVHEMQDEKHWSNAEMRRAMDLMGEPTPYYLHAHG